MVASVGRAGPVFTGATTREMSETGYQLTLQLAPGALADTPVGARVKQTLDQYMRAYAKMSGWRMGRLSFRRGYVAFTLGMTVSRARSSSSRNA
jgi:aminoglycoside phosphotransferase (APT) family kinase protein